MYTDGVTDALGRDGERYGHRRLHATLDACRELAARQVIERLNTALASFQVGPHADDTAALALRRLSVSDPSPADEEASDPHPVSEFATTS